MTRSKAHLQGYKEEPAKERPKGEDTEVNVGNTNEEIDQFTLGLEDNPASPPHDLPQGQPQAQP